MLSPIITTYGHVTLDSTPCTGLLSSSCCLLQLGINFLSTLDLIHVGCAGFNKSLGPIRTPLRIGTLVWLGGLWISHIYSKQGSKNNKEEEPGTGGGGKGASLASLLLRTLLTCGLMFLPEILLWAGQPAMAPPTGRTRSFDLQLEGMGCEACQLHVQRVLEGSGGVVSATVDYKSGKASVVWRRGGVSTSPTRDRC